MGRKPDALQDDSVVRRTPDELWQYSDGNRPERGLFTPKVCITPLSDEAIRLTRNTSSVCLGGDLVGMGSCDRVPEPLISALAAAEELSSSRKLTVKVPKLSIEDELSVGAIDLSRLDQDILAKRGKAVAAHPKVMLHRLDPAMVEDIPEVTEGNLVEIGPATSGLGEFDDADEDWMPPGRKRRRISGGGPASKRRRTNGFRRRGAKYAMKPKVRQRTVLEECKAVMRAIVTHVTVALDGSPRTRRSEIPATPSANRKVPPIPVEPKFEVVPEPTPYEPDPDRLVEIKSIRLTRGQTATPQGSPGPEMPAARPYRSRTAKAKTIVAITRTPRGPSRTGTRGRQLGTATKGRFQGRATRVQIPDSATRVQQPGSTTRVQQPGSGTAGRQGDRVPKPRGRPRKQGRPKGSPRGSVEKAPSEGSSSGGQLPTDMNENEDIHPPPSPELAAQNPAQNSPAVGAASIQNCSLLRDVLERPPVVPSPVGPTALERDPAFRAEVVASVDTIMRELDPQFAPQIQPDPPVVPSVPPVRPVSTNSTTGRPTATCYTCNITYKSTKEYRMHEAAYHQEWHVCTICDAPFTTRRGLDSHMRSQWHQQACKLVDRLSALIQDCVREDGVATDRTIPLPASVQAYENSGKKNDVHLTRCHSLDAMILYLQKTLRAARGFSGGYPENQVSPPTWDAPSQSIPQYEQPYAPTGPPQSTSYSAPPYQHQVQMRHHPWSYPPAPTLPNAYQTHRPGPLPPSTHGGYQQQLSPPDIMPGVSYSSPSVPHRPPPGVSYASPMAAPNHTMGVSYGSPSLSTPTYYNQGFMGVPSQNQNQFYQPQGYPQPPGQGAPLPYAPGNPPNPTYPIQDGTSNETYELLSM